MENTKLRRIFFLLAISYVLSDRFVGGTRNGTMESKVLVKHKGTVKTIEGKDGDVIDCVDIYQQPAFDHPLLKNHIIQMKPSSIPNVRNREFYEAELVQGLVENEECPEGTIPIRHARKDEYYAKRGILPEAHQKKLNIHLNYDTRGHYERARADLSGANYFGAHAFINVWNPVTNDGEVSTAQIWLRTGASNLLNTMEAGSMVNSRNGEPKLFIRWTRDGYQTTGCYNLECPGFVQVNRKFVLGSFLKPISTYKGTQYTIEITIYKDKNDKNWWLQVKDQVLGYWPESIFKDLETSATTVSWGGEIYDSMRQGHHTTTQMGSGHFSREGFRKASYFRNIQYMDDMAKFNDADIAAGLVPAATKPSCYDISVANNKNAGYGTHLYFGGPGYSAMCP